MPGPQRRREEARGLLVDVVLVGAHALERLATRALDLFFGEGRVSHAIGEQLEPARPAAGEELRLDAELVSAGDGRERAADRGGVGAQPGGVARPRAARERRREQARDAVRARVLEARAT